MFLPNSLDNSGEVPTLSVIISLHYTPIIMMNSKTHNEKPKRRFCAAMDGPRIRRLYATMRTADLFQIFFVHLQPNQRLASARTSKRRWQKSPESKTSLPKHRQGRNRSQTSLTERRQSQTDAPTNLRTNPQGRTETDLRLPTGRQGRTRVLLHLPERRQG